MRASRAAGVTLFFLVWAIVFTYPLVFHLGDSVALSAGGDAYLHLWNLWWADKSLIDLHQNPFHTTYLYYPTGASLYYHSLDLVNGIASIPLQRVLGLTSAFNLLMIANLVLDGVAAYWLCKELTGSTGAALVGGVLFESGPLMGASYNLGQLDQVIAWWIPLYLLALWRILESPGKPWQAGGGRRATLCAGLCLAGASLATWYYTAGLVVFTLFFVPAYLWVLRRTHDEGPATSTRQPPSSSVLRSKSFLSEAVNAGLKLGVAVLLMAILLSPLLRGMIRERLSGATYMIPSFETTYATSADLVALFLPGRTEIPGLGEHGINVALGWVALALTGLGLLGGLRRRWPILLGLLAVVLVSLGPELQVAGVDTHITLPYGLLNNVPFIGASRQPLRFLMTAAALLSLTSAYGVTYLLDRWRDKSWRRAVVPVVMLLVALELFGIPRALISTQAGGAYTFIRDQKDPGGVVELPYELWQARSEMNATAHGKPILGGYTSRHFPYPFIEGAPGAAQLVVGYPAHLAEPDIITPTLELTALASLDYYGVRYVVVHKSDLASGRFGRLVSLVNELYPGGPAYEDGEALVYKTPMGLSQNGNSLPLVGLGKGWHELEENPLRRWTGNDPGNGNAQVWVGIRPEAAGPYTLKLEAFSFGKPRHLTVVVNGYTLLQKEVGLAPETLDIDMGTLAAGDYVVELNVQEQPESPPNDRRLLSMGYTQVAVERR